MNRRGFLRRAFGAAVAPWASKLAPLAMAEAEAVPPLQLFKFPMHVPLPADPLTYSDYTRTIFCDIVIAQWADYYPSHLYVAPGYFTEKQMHRDLRMKVSRRRR